MKDYYFSNPFFLLFFIVFYIEYFKTIVMSFIKLQFSLHFIFLICLNTIPAYLFAQVQNKEELSKQEIKLLKLEEKVERAQDKVERYETKLAEADSFIYIGAQMEAEAKAEIAIIRNEEQAFIKDQNARLKQLSKRSKKVSDEKQKEIDIQYKALDAEYKSKTREFEKRFSTQFRKLEKGTYNQEKGKEKQKQYDPVLKDAQKSLEMVEEELINYKNEYGFD